MLKFFFKSEDVLDRDSLKTTLGYYNRMSRSDPGNESNTESEAGAVGLLAFQLWNERDGAKKINLEIGNPETSGDI